MLDLKSIESIFKAVPTPCIVLLTDAPHYTIVSVNDAYCAATGRKASELLNKPAFEAFPANPDNHLRSVAEDLRLSYERVVMTGKTEKLDILKYDIPVRGTSGFEVRYWSPENVPVLNERGEVEFIIHTVTDVTSQVLAEQKERSANHELAKHQKHYRSLFHHHPDAVFSFDLQGHFLSANQRSSGLAECPLEELLNSSFARLIAPEDLARVNGHFLKACTGEIQNYNTGFITTKGNYKILNVTNLPIIIDEEIIGVYGIAKDITNELEADRKLDQSREQLRKIMDYSLDIICIANSEGRIVKMSKASLNIWGFHAEELEGKTFFDLMQEDDKERSRKMANDIIAGTETTRFFNRYKRKDGRVVTMSWSAFWDKDEELMYCVARDITEYIAATEKIKSNENRFRSLIKNSKEGIALIAKDGFVIERSYSALKILGLSPSEQERPWLEIIHPDDLEKAKKVLSEILTCPEESKTIECRLAGSEKWIEFTLNNRLNDTAIQAIVINSRDVTEKKNASRVLKSSEERYRNLFYNNPLPMWIYETRTLRFLEVNQAAVEKYGYTQEEFLKMCIKDIRPPEDVPLLKKVRGTRTKYGIRYDGHWRHMTKNGDLLFVDITSQSIDHGNCEATLILADDITKRLQAEQDTRTSEEVRTLIMDAAFDSIVCMDRNGSVTLWNSQAEKLFGWKREEIIGKDLAEFIIPEQFRQMHHAGLKRYNRTGEGSMINKLVELTALKRDRKEFPVELTIVPIENAGNNFFCAFIRDITERKHYITALDRSEKRYKALVQEGSDLINILDHEGKYKYASPASAAMIGLTPEGVVGCSAYEYIHEDDRDMIAEALSSLATKKRVTAPPFRFKGQSGEYRWLESLGTNLLDDPAVEGIVINSKDVTDRINHIRAIEEQNTKLREIGWMQSHLVRAPLTRIMGLANVISNYADEDIDTTELLGCIVTSAHELDSVIRNIIENTRE